MLSGNPSIFELDYNAIKERCSIYKWELLEVALHPSRIEKYIEMGIEMGELVNYMLLANPNAIFNFTNPIRNYFVIN